MIYPIVRDTGIFCRLGGASRAKSPQYLAIYPNLYVNSTAKVRFYFLFHNSFHEKKYFSSSHGERDAVAATVDLKDADADVLVELDDLVGVFDVLVG